MASILSVYLTVESGLLCSPSPAFWKPVIAHALGRQPHLRVWRTQCHMSTTIYCFSDLEMVHSLRIYNGRILVT